MQAPQRRGLGRGVGGQAQVVLVAILLALAVLLVVGFLWLRSDASGARSTAGAEGALRAPALTSTPDVRQPAPVGRVVTPAAPENVDEVPRADQEQEQGGVRIRDVPLDDFPRMPDDERSTQLASLRRDQDDATRLATARDILAHSATDGPMVARALEVLGELAPESVAGELRRLLTELPDTPRNQGTLSNAIRNLGMREGILSATDLVAFFEDGNNEVQVAAAAALAHRGDDSLSLGYQERRAVDLASDDPFERSEALRDLTSLQSASTLPLLVPMLQDANEDVRLQALTAVQQAGGMDSLDAIRPLLNDSSPRVRRAAERLIETMERRLELNARSAEDAR